jgi:hypothetical protein
MLDSALFTQVLLHPARMCDELCVVSGYASPAFVQTHLYNLAQQKVRNSLRIRLVVGMVVSDGISEINHNSFQRLARSLNGSFTCKYVLTKPPVHSKLYVWLQNKEPVLAYIGSVNYSSNGFFGNREIVASCDPILGFEYFQKLYIDATYCDEVELSQIKTKKPSQIVNNQTLSGMTTESDSTATIEVSLLDAKGEIHMRSGLNWGQREKREPNQAYIALNGSIRTSNFFPVKGVVFTVICDDGESFEMVVAQQGSKALETPQSNAMLGKYFRKRLGLPEGAFVTIDSLKSYGRTTVTFRKLSDELYYMDFSKSK